jgi:hypothetical protein
MELEVRVGAAHNLPRDFLSNPNPYILLSISSQSTKFSTRIWKSPQPLFLLEIL